jgi:UDP-N-acetylmuramoyl-tripeptide--D-alanyl-D-alanine ligase
VPAIRVKSCISAFMHMAHHYRSKFKLPVVGITGSNGKTTTKELLGWVLAEEGPTIYSERSFNNYVGVPLTLFRIDSDTRYAVLELGTNSPGEIAVLTGLAAPEVGLITNISDCHLEGLKDREGIIREKSDLLAGLVGQNVSVLNRDDSAYDQLVQAATGKVVTFGICHRSDYTAIHIDVDFHGVTFEVEGVQVRLPLLGFHSIYNALGAYACARELGVSPERIASVFQRFESPPMRLKPIQQGSLFVVNDAYNANPGSMESAIKTFSVLPAQGRKVVVLGDMLELADQSPSLHRKVGEQLSCGDFDLVVAVGDRAREYLVGAGRCGVPEEKLVSFEDTDKAMETFPDLITPKDSILVKGSRKMGLERLVEAVLAAGI